MSLCYCFEGIIFQNKEFQNKEFQNKEFQNKEFQNKEFQNKEFHTMRVVAHLSRIAMTASAVALTLLLAAPQSKAQSNIVPITVDGRWEVFTFFATGPMDQPDGFTLTALTPVSVRLTDVFGAGDSFDVFVNSLLTFQTPSVPDTNPFVENPDVAFLNPAYSNGQFVLPAGDYAISVSVREFRDFPGSGAYISAVTFVSAAAPEPTALGLFCLGATFALVAARRKKR